MSDESQVPTTMQRIRTWATPTHEDGADSDGVENPNTHDGADGEPLSGEFGIGPATTGPLVGGPPEPARTEPVVELEPMVEVEPVEVERPNRWITNPFTLNEVQPRIIAEERPSRCSLVITNTHETETMAIGPDESSCFRTIQPGKSYEADHTARIYALGDGTTCEVDESLFG